MWKGKRKLRLPLQIDKRICNGLEKAKMWQNHKEQNSGQGGSVPISLEAFSYLSRYYTASLSILDCDSRTIELSEGGAYEAFVHYLFKIYKDADCKSFTEFERFSIVRTPMDT